MLPFLGLAMQTRGRDAWGASNGQVVLKHVGELTESWHEDRDRINTWDAGIFHTRGASFGSGKVLANAHPFEYIRADGDRVIGIHNGAITNHHELDTKYKRHCEVDSMHLWMHRAEGKPWSDIEGWGNLAWWEMDDRGRRLISLARFNSDNLAVARLEQGEMVFCSELGAIRTIARMMGNPVQGSWVLDEHHRYYFHDNDQGVMTLWRDEQRLPFPDPYSAAAWEEYGCGYTGGGNLARKRYQQGPVHPPMSGLDGLCAKCGDTRVASKAQVLCQACLGEMTTEFLKWKEPAPFNVVPVAGASNGSVN